MTNFIPRIPADRFEWDDYFESSAHLSDLGLKEIPEEFIIVDEYQSLEYHFTRRSSSMCESTRIDVYDGVLDGNDSTATIYSYEE